MAAVDAVAEAPTETTAEPGIETGADAAGETTAPTVVRGTFTLYMTKSYVIQALAKDFVITPVNPWLHSVIDNWTATTYQIKSGNIDLRNGTGILVMDGGTVVSNVKTGQSMVLFDIRFDLATHAISYTWKSQDGDPQVDPLEVVGGQGGVWGRSGSYTSQGVYFGREAGAFVNELLTTTALDDRGLFGAVATQFELLEDAPTDGIVQWGPKL